jgi:hypothetical protein
MRGGAARTGVAGAVLVAVGMAGAGAVSGQADEAYRPAVTGSVQVTANPAPVRAHSSPQIALNPVTGELVVVEADVRTDRACRAHISLDQGRSWRPGGSLMVDPYNDCGFYAEYGPYATAAFGRDGTLYVAFVASELLARARNDVPRHVFLARSTDSGRSFQTTRVFEAPDGNQERGLNKGPMLAVDPTNPARVYVGWRQGVFTATTPEKLKSNIAASHDGGRTFRPPVEITDSRGGDYPAIAVGNDGTVHAVYWARTFGVPATAPGEQAPLREIMYARSTDGGATFTPARVIDPGNQSASRPALLAHDPLTGNLYMVWHGNPEPNNTGAQYQGHLDVFMRTSTDGGATWGERVVVNDDTVRANQFEPGISIAPDGRVDIAWYDFRHSPSPPIVSPGHNGDKGMSDVYYSYSTDGGRSFAPNVRVTDRSIDRSVGVWGNDINSKFNMGIASDRRGVYLAWQDSRNAVGESHSEDVYSAAVWLEGAQPVLSGGSTATPAWLLLGAGLALGLGAATVAAWLLARRTTGSPARVAVRA